MNVLIESNVWALTIAKESDFILITISLFAPKIPYILFYMLLETYRP